MSGKSPCGREMLSKSAGWKEDLAKAGEADLAIVGGEMGLRNVKGGSHVTISNRDPP